MKQNMGNADRGIRLIVGLSLLIWGFWTQNYFGLIGFILIGTAFIKWCPLYAPFKLSTYRGKQRELS